MEEVADAVWVFGPAMKLLTRTDHHLPAGCMVKRCCVDKHPPPYGWDGPLHVSASVLVVIMMKHEDEGCEVQYSSSLRHQVERII